MLASGWRCLVPPIGSRSGRPSAAWIWPCWAPPPRPRITDTAVTQPLVVATTLLAHESWPDGATRRDGRRQPLGRRIAAYAIAGVISADDAVRLAAVRGSEMAKACALEPTGMSAVLGGDEDEVLARLEALELIPANRNAAGQIVAAGAITALEKLAEDPPAKARVRQLATAGRSTPTTWAPLSTAMPPPRPR